MNIMGFNQHYIAKQIKDSKNKSYKENCHKSCADEIQIYDFNWEKYVRVCDDGGDYNK